MQMRRKCWRRHSQQGKRLSSGLMFHTIWWLIPTLLKFMTRRHLLVMSGARRTLPSLLWVHWRNSTPPCSAMIIQMLAPSCKLMQPKNVNRVISYHTALACVLLENYCTVKFFLKYIWRGLWWTWGNRRVTWIDRNSVGCYEMAIRTVLHILYMMFFVISVHACFF